MYIVRGVDQNQPRLIQRAIRQNANIRRNITAYQLSLVVAKRVPHECPILGVMNQALEKLLAVAQPTDHSDDKNEYLLDDLVSTNKNLPGKCYYRRGFFI